MTTLPYGTHSRSRFRTLFSSFALAAFIVLLALATVDKAQAQTFHTLYTFAGIPDGATPSGSVIVDANGTVYGATTYGGTGQCTDEYGDLIGCGTVFELSNGKETVLYNFAAGMGGNSPAGNLARDNEGNLYGTTTYGGGGSACSMYGCGTVFKLSKNSKLTVLYAFQGVPDGNNPVAGVIRNRDGTLYGTTYNGGDRRCTYWGCGVVFEVGKYGKEGVLHRFTGSGRDGAFPIAGVAQDVSGTLYGTTFGSGTGGYGTVFEIGKGRKETILYSFSGGTDGAYVSGGVALDASGNLYGTTQSGGDLACDNGYGCGTVFKLDTMGKETVLHSFRGGPMV